MKQRNKRNPVARAVRTPKFRMRVVANKKHTQRKPKHRKTTHGFQEEI